MESLFHIKCHKILDQQQERVAVGTVGFFQIGILSADSTKLEELKILMYPTNGENDTSRDK